MFNFPTRGPCINYVKNGKKNIYSHGTSDGDVIGDTNSTAEHSTVGNQQIKEAMSYWNVGQSNATAEIEKIISRLFLKDILTECLTKKITRVYNEYYYASHGFCFQLKILHFALSPITFYRLFTVPNNAGFWSDMILDRDKSYLLL